MYIEEIVRKFDNVRKTGENQYSCRCPAHKDKSNSMGVAEKDGNILINCFAGCSVKSILDAVNLTWKDILGENEYDEEMRKTFNPYAVLKMLRDEVLLVGLCARQTLKGEKLSDKDINRLWHAIANIRDAYAKYL